jgi:hypothetical protein
VGGGNVVEVIIRWKPLAIGLGSALAFLLVFCLAPVKVVSYTVDEMYQTTETYYVTEAYTVEEPYVDIEIYYETEPYDKSVPIDYVVTGEEGYNYFGGGGFYVRVYIKNTLEGGVKDTESKSKYIAAGKTEMLTVSYHGAALRSFTYSITPPTKTVTAYRDVPKTREVIKYQPVIKYRYVPKERTVWETRLATRWKMVPMLEYLRSY